MVKVAKMRVFIDDSKCKRPPECTVCLRKCPMNVFQTYPMNDWKVAALWTNVCVGCGLCIDACPARAIHVEYDSKPITGGQMRFLGGEHRGADLLRHGELGSPAEERRK